MRIYRNEYKAEGGCSGGFSFHTTKVAADAARNTYFRENANDEYAGCEQEEVELDLTREGVLSLLRKWAAHPDNG